MTTTADRLRALAAEGRTFIDDPDFKSLTGSAIGKRLVEIKEVRAALHETAAEELDRMRKALLVAADQFEKYAREHRAKAADTTLSDIARATAGSKGEVNALHARRCREALLDSIVGDYPFIERRGNGNR